MNKALLHSNTSFRKKGLFLLVILNIVCLISFLLLFLRLTTPADQVEITLNKDGFSPKNVTIKKGTIVTFKTNVDAQFWPASDPHPTHTIFPTFDPRRPILPTESWSFTFQKEGVWKFHDHLSPYFTGTITVADEHGIPPTLSFCNDIDKLPKSEKVQCWDSTMETILTTQGLDKGFDYLDKMYQTEPDFQSECHNFAHKLGEKAFTLYLEKKDFQPSAKAYYCAYGFYHGFMEKLLHTTGDVKQAQGFCDYLDRKLHNQTTDAGGACMHGIGHGTVADTPDPALWGNAQAIIDRGLKQCEQVVRSNAERFRCATGVYNAYEILASAHEYKLSNDPNDPFSICRKQKDIYKASCYPQLSVVASNYAKGDWNKAIGYANTISENAYAISAAQAILVERVQLHESFDEPIKFCREIPTRFHDICIQSYAEGFLKYGPPQNEYKQALTFCESPILTSSEEALCFSRFLGILRNLYTKEKAQAICLTAPKEYQYNSCKYE